MEIKILGTGCTKCNDLYNNVLEVLSKVEMEIEIEKIEDIPTIMSFGVMSTPALVIDGKVIVSGRVPQVEEIEKLFK